MLVVDVDVIGCVVTRFQPRKHLVHVEVLLCHLPFFGEGDIAGGSKGLDGETADQNRNQEKTENLFLHRSSSFIQWGRPSGSGWLRSFPRRC